ncbi:ATP-binding protein [Xanthomonas hortorum pv. vitians]|uniref:ATP-binding protein n=1 Tax=Xanthomonas hortorum pv. vitians TaxID=83224 RepID=A0A6V7C1R5_9XANT|nr:SbcC/MukB-like Walker B domain-containing protein [Xanthomonas hortorum]ASW47149.1 ATP-binding protein [Xanthomonas hortorum]MCC8495077.1 ATP-binding protein [Xanthomonas hortorum pv. gardneri]MCE4299163.1 ATP-binding protein [Xanthomonas hortorum pv. vitians]MCE4303645.1 ATP-binding protein [Xanthomonas hortorum pv. vitians]MCE4307829.1 ATP-binding protein [Xanthomonas hortorum pv. vitians]
MTSSAAPSSLFANDLPDARLQQFRMRRLQVHNWGTFSGLTEVPIAERGFLFVGRSGSGKSTLLDAMSALLTPPSIVDFNAAAREAERSGRDRNLVSYVRGAWADQQDSASGEIATQYLRKGATWTALVLEYRNGEDRVVSLVRLFWIAGNSAATGDVRKHYMVAERAFDVAQDLAGFDLDLRKLKQRLHDVHHFDSFAGYAERFRHQLGIGNEMALRLLHKTQSAKNLGDLNAFLRGFMLEEPKTFDAAERLVGDFAELDGAHHAVVTARRQVETLLPARAHHAELMQLRRQRSELEELKLGIDAYREQRRLALLDARLQELDVQDRGLAGEEGQRRAALDNHTRHLDDLEAQRRAQGGERIDALEREQGQLQTERDRRAAKRAQAEQACRALEQALADSAHGFAEQVAQARAALEDGQRAAAELDEAISERIAGKHDDSKRFAEVRAEIEALTRNPSNIPAPMQSLRARMSADTGVPEAALPFVGELIQVREEASTWRGAIERVLHGFAQSLLVDERHYAEVADWVNRTQLGTRLVYYRVRHNEQALSGREPGSVSLLHKLELRDHPFAGWLRRELGKRFDYDCVDSAKALRHAERAITREGQVKHPGERYEKDDRHAVGDRRRWLLGFNNRDKLALFEREGQELAQRIAACDAEVADLRARRERDGQRRLARNTLANLGWDEIDVAAALQRLSQIAETLQQLREGDANLRALGEAIDRTRADIAQATRTYEGVRTERITLGAERTRLEKQHLECADAHARLVTPLQQQGLAERLLSLGELSLDNLQDRFRTLERGLDAQLGVSKDELTRLQQALIGCFRRYFQQWPEDSGDLSPTLEGADDFLARLQRLERDGLPQHEARFFELLQSQSKNNLLALQRHTAEARKSIAQRLDEVNASLEQVPFNHGTLLTIELSDRRLPEVIEFHQRLRDVLGHHQTEQREVAEQQFAVLRELVRKLGSAEGEDKRWRELVLDVRLHVEFVGVELDAATRQQVEIYRSGAGKSGGQRQKLATTCLAAALRYQLGGEDGELPRYCAVVLDEAFDKADNEFTALAMNIFENFGFQMVVATPLKSVMTLEPFIGGACFVEISGRHDSGVLLIEYDEQSRRLKLPERTRSAAANTTAVAEQE